MRRQLQTVGAQCTISSPHMVVTQQSLDIIVEAPTAVADGQIAYITKTPIRLVSVGY